VTAHSVDVDGVLAANAELYAAFEAGDLDRMTALWVSEPYSDDALCVHPGWVPLRGRGPVLRSWAVIMANTSYVQFVLTDVRADVAGDVAVVTCRENILTAIGDPTHAGDSLSGGSTVATNVFRRTAEGWRLWVHHASPILGRGSDSGTDEEDSDVADADEDGEAR
jgi:ketosteroid isomerase-like protein